ncbi:MAG: 3-deoxy-manno-octulosonate cytidylyltransferase [Candidatus Latescibacteria bacterium]|nr:3-deoxy-manno-octulosonate cytidylyltransferase [Candidatus Latescibacterota bacterium]
MRTIGIIPARFGSTRFPGKPLADIRGRPMIWHVYQSCLKAKSIDQLLVATDDRRIYDCVAAFGGLAVMTSKKHRSGTDRIAEALEKFEVRSSRFEIIVNIQGDEPLIDPGAIDLLARAMAGRSKPEMATLVGIFKDKKDLSSPNTAKVVADGRGYAMYFSRSVIPGSRGISFRLSNYLKHIGIYAYRRDILFKLISWPQSALEKVEKLEQLRALEHGVKIKMIKTGYHPLAVDTPADLSRINKILRTQSFT